MPTESEVAPPIVRQGTKKAAEQRGVTAVVHTPATGDPSMSKRLARVRAALRKSRHVAKPKATIAKDQIETFDVTFASMSERWAGASLGAVIAIEQGLPFSALDDIDALLPGTLRRIIPRSTLAAQKKKADTLTPAQGERLYQLGKVFGFATTVYGDTDSARRFLTRPHPMLDDRTPLDIALESGAGADLVVNLLGRGAYGGGA